jgi:hypothetical protein
MGFKTLKWEIRHIRDIETRKERKKKGKKEKQKGKLHPLWLLQTV